MSDNKADFILELLNNFPFVKARAITDKKAQLFEEIKEAVDNLNMAKDGKLKAKPLNELLNEL